MAHESDPSTLSNYREVAFTSWHLNVEANFAAKKLVGTVTLRGKVLFDKLEQVVLDTRGGLTVQSITEQGSNINLDFQFGKENPALGIPLTIQAPSSGWKKGDEVALTISYKTSPDSTTIQWLEPEQTAGKKHPYLFTQCQIILARTLFPCQDTPAIKSTYTAEITVPKDLTALMSAAQCGSHPSPSSPDKTVFEFEQKIPIPVYLTALVVGALESRKVGPRSHVWCEKEMIEKAAYEFAQTEDMLRVAEDIAGPYLWGHYDILVLPPSFPFGGMENPNLTFATPTLLAGDRSLVNVIAHEISHSWTGNLVTNSSWEHFWLNEGFTRYLESLIIGQLRGEKERHLRAMIGWKALEDAVAQFGADHNYTSMIPNLEGVDPDDAYCSVPYEKGFSLLYQLETLVGVEGMKGYLRAHVEKFKYGILDSDQWKEFFLEHFKKAASEGVFDVVDWKMWFYGVGLPTYKPKYDTSLADGCIQLADRWAATTGDETEGGFTAGDLDTMSSNQIQEFLNQLHSKPPLSQPVLERMDKIYSLSSRQNCEVKFRWLRVCLKVGWTKVFPEVVQFVTQQGRLKFIRPLYCDLNSCPGGGKELAVKTFTANRSGYHPIAIVTIAKDLGLE